MAISTFTLTIRERTLDGINPTSVDVAVYPLASNDGALLKEIKDTTGQVVLSGHAVKKVRDKDRVDTAEVTLELPDPRDTSLNPTGFGYRVHVTTNYFSRPAVIFGSAELDAHESGGVLYLEDVTEVDPAAFDALATYVERPTGGTDGQALVKSGTDVVWGDVSGSTPDASTTIKGLVELATNSETTTGADTVRATTPAGVAAAITAGVTTETNRATAAEAALQDGTNSTFTNRLDASYAPRPTLRKIPWPYDPATGSLVTEFAAGHGFTLTGADGTSNINDTTTGLSVFGTQCATVVTGGTGANATLANTSVGPYDTTKLQAMVLLKCDDNTHLSSMNLSIGNSGAFTNSYAINFGNVGSIPSGQWVWVSMSFADAQIQGSPTRTSVNAVRLYFKDDNTGNKVTVHWGGIWFFPNAATMPGAPFPKGVASIGFDDAYLSQWEVAKPYLDARGIRATLFPIKEYVGGFTNRLTLAQVKSMQDQSGWEVSPHAATGADHAARFTTLTTQQLADDLKAQKDWFLANGLDGQGGAYPGGQSNQAVVEQVRKTARYARNTVPLCETWPPADPYRIKAFSSIGTYSGGLTPSTIYADTTGKIDLAVAEAAWLNLCFHNIVPDVVSVVMSGNIATITFAGGHGFSSGSAITLSGFTPAGLNGNFTIASAPTLSTITVNIGSNPGNSTIQGKALTASTDCALSDFKLIVDKLVSSGIAILPIGEVISGVTRPPAYMKLPASPTDGQLAAWNNTTGLWVPVNPSGTAEIAYAENNTGTTTSIPNTAAATDIASTTVVIPAGPRPVYLSAQCLFKNTSGGTGTSTSRVLLLITEVSNGVDTPLQFAFYVSMVGMAVSWVSGNIVNAKVGVPAHTRTFKLQALANIACTVDNGNTGGTGRSWLLAEAK